MTSVREIKREIEILDRVLAPKEKENSDNLNQLLKKYEQLTSGLTANQQHEIVKEVVADLQEKGLIH